MNRRRGLFLLLGLLLLAGYGGLLLSYSSFSVGGSDSSGYLNSARRIVTGELVTRPRGLDRLGLPDEMVQRFIPLGFVPGPRPGTMAPFYPPGFPLHMAAAALVFGWDLGPFLVSPLAGVVSVLLMYLLGRQFLLPPAWSAAGAAMLGGWTAFFGQAIQPMSDATATLWSLAAVLFAMRARRKPGWALAAGASFAVAFLVRPTSALLLAPLAFALPLSPLCIVLFGAGGAPFAAWLALYNFRSFGSPMQSGYGKIGLVEALALKNFPPRFQHYGGWILRTLTPLVPAGWLAVAANRGVPRRDRALLLTWFGVFFAFYCLYEPYDSFWFVRFLMPAAPALFVGALLTARKLVMLLGGGRRVVAVALLLLLLVLAVSARQIKQVGILGMAEGEAVYPASCAWAERTLPPKSIILAMAASGALENYTDLPYARWDWFEPRQFTDMIPRVERRGYRWFALLFPFEAEALPKHVPGRWEKLGTLGQVGLWRLER